MRYLKDFRTNPQISVLHNVRAVQSRKGWREAEVLRAIADAEAGIAYEFCEICDGWKPLDCGSEHS
jgi:hypothetical protein